METQYTPSLVILSVLVAAISSFLALNLAYSVTQAKGRAQALWLACGAIAMGVGIWSMHFIGMLAFEMPGMEMAYDLPLLVLSVVVAIVASAHALYIVSRPVIVGASIVSGGIAMAAAIAGMHYIGMFSMRMQARIEWDIYLVLASIAVALLASFAALTIAIRLRDKPDHLSLLTLASVLMGLGISGMHYTGMAAATFIHDTSVKIDKSDLVVNGGLVWTVVSATLVILAIALLWSIGQRVLASRAQHAEDAVSTTEEKFRALVESVEDYAILMLDPEGHVTTWNSGAQKITGYTSAEAVGNHVSMFYAKPDTAQITEREFEIACQYGKFQGDAIRMRKDGSTFWANIVIIPLFSKDGQIKGYSKVIRDVTQLKNAEENMRQTNEELEKRVHDRTTELEERERQLRTITNAIPVLVAQADQSQKLLFANEPFCDWFNLKRTALGQTLSSLLGQAHYSAHQEHIDAALKGEITSYELEFGNGEQRKILNITVVPELDRYEKVHSFIMVATDVTKYKEIESELKRAKEAAEVANETKSAFLANMSHEIRTPLGAVLGFSELLLSEEASPSEKEKGIEIIKRNGRLLSNIINDILDLSKVEAGRLQIEKSPTLFQEIMVELGSLLTLEAQEKGIKLTFLTEGPIPSIINTDPLRLRQILFNIIGNAIKFTDKGSVTVKSKLIFDGGSNKLAFFVQDTGEGIKAEQIHRLFAPFTQADSSTTRRAGGTGLGLALSRKLAQALGGDVTLVKSEYGVGSLFCILVDPGTTEEVLFNSTEVNQLPKNVASIRSAHTRQNLNGLKILLAEDSIDNQELIKRILNLAGADVETASNGKEAMEKILNDSYRLVLMDLQMPEMDGYETTKRLREQGVTLPIIALTAHAMKEERSKCLKNGFNDYLTKPVDRDALIRTLASYQLSV